MTEYKLYHGDCLEVMQKLVDDEVKVDMVLTDPPYGVTSCKWDEIIPLKELWQKPYTLINDNVPVLLFGSEPYSTIQRMSNLKNFKYDWIWNKGFGSNFMVAKYQPLLNYEVISVFYKKAPTYHPQKWKVNPKQIRNRINPSRGGAVGNTNKIKPKDYIDDGTRYPWRIINISALKNETAKQNRYHPTQKPVELLEYLIKTYTNKGNTVLDFTMGSGSTGVACMNLNRKFIGIELEREYYNIAEERIREASNPKQQKLI